MLAVKSHTNRDLGVNLSMDSATTTESGDSQKQDLPVLLSNQTHKWPSDGESGKMDGAKEGQGYDLDFITALTMK